MNFKYNFIREALLKSPWGDIFSPWESNLTPKLVFLSPRGSNFHYHSLPPYKVVLDGNGNSRRKVDTLGQISITMEMDNDIFHKFTHKFIPITIIYDQLPNGQ